MFAVRFAVLLLTVILLQCATACHQKSRRRHKRSNDNPDFVNETNYMRNFMTGCVEKKIGSDVIQSMESVVDFSVLDSKWFEKNDLELCSNSNGNDTNVCWKKALNSFVKSSSFLFKPTKDCIDEYMLATVGDHNCTRDGWTPFFNVDSPGSGSGDHEQLNYVRQLYPKKICQYPNGLEARSLTSGKTPSETGQSIDSSVNLGLICINNQQRALCDDYMVRYCCPFDPASKCQDGDWTKFYNLDKPGGNGDFEQIHYIRSRDKKMCPFPSAMEVRIANNEADYLSAGQNVSADLSHGFYCQNHKQLDGRLCQDYEVRFCCPKVVRPFASYSPLPNKGPVKRSASAMPPLSNGTGTASYTNCFTNLVDLPTNRPPLNMQSVIQLVRFHLLSEGSPDQQWQVRLEQMVRTDSPIQAAIQVCNEEVYNISSNGWSAWNTWGNCPSRCGESGYQLRRRQCINGQAGIGICPGPLEETRLCQPRLCWGPWSACSATCGRNIQRTRRLVCTKNFQHESACRNMRQTETGSCTLMPCNGWSEWAQWSSCGSQCGQQMDRRRTRFCTYGQAGVLPCLGNTEETEPCKVSVPKCSEWKAWTHCSATCGKLTRSRTRECKPSSCQPVSSQTGDCPDLKPCKTAVSGRWSQWSQWGYCPLQCGLVTKQRRRRYCMTGGHPPCKGSHEEIRNCKQSGACWTQWSAFSTCLGCGSSMISRSRICVNGTPGINGCWGRAKDERPCYTEC